MKKLALAIFMLCPILTTTTAYSCTRVVYKGPDNYIITARSMDWKDEIAPNLWIFPRNLNRNGNVGPHSVTWTSRYGSIITSAWDMATTDGLNEKGLVANVLWLVESEYPAFDPASGTPGLTISAWAQYVLDNFATVSETVHFFSQTPFTIVSDYIPGSDKFTTLHLSLSDASGDNAIFEYIGGKLQIHHNPDYTVMTNSPPFEQQLAINTYWKSIPGTVMLPGSNRAADRFVRASFFINAIPQTSDARTAVASVFSVIRNCSVPYGISTPGEPNISSTRWRALSDQKHLIYYFETALTPNTFWVDLNKVDFNKLKQAQKLDLSGHRTYSGETSGLFKDATPFTFAGI